MLEKKRRFLTKKTPIFSKKTKIFWKKTAIFLCKNERIENQALTKAIFLLENALKKSVFFAEKVAFLSEKSRRFFAK